MKLEACPFCGGEAKVIGNAENNSGFFVMCWSGEKCGCKLGDHMENGLPYHKFRTIEEATRAWNRRVVDSQPEWLSQALNEGDGVYRP